MHQDEKIASKKEVLQRRWYEARMDKITLLNHPVDVLCDNVRQNATKVIVSSSPLKSGLQVSVGHFFYLISQKISYFWLNVKSRLICISFLNFVRKRTCAIMSCQELDPVEAFLEKSPTASVRELHVICKGPSGKEQRKGTLSVANPVSEKFRPSWQRCVNAIDWWSVIYGIREMPRGGFEMGSWQIVKAFFCSV